MDGEIALQKILEEITQQTSLTEGQIIIISRGLRYAYGVGFDEARKYANHAPVICITPEGQQKRYISLRDAAKALNVDVSAICKAIKNKHKVKKHIFLYEKQK